MTVSETEAPVLDVIAAPLTVEGFAPFGEVIGARGRAPLDYDLYEGRDDNFVAASLDADHPVELLLMRSHVREFRVRYLERHHEIAQAFIPLGGNPFVCVVAAADAAITNGLPELSAVRAFLVGGDEGVAMRRGTWHEPPFALAQGATTLVSSHRALTEALGSPRDANGEIHGGDVEKLNVTARAGVVVRVQLP